ncbi:MAG: hypothetical protein AUJ71_03015 [Candidatus Omnitrophica bacterium CG1_02_49_16]|nr:MAG: hypothetical protein AUJ71_03015 [Candidatus Omnitrophica bacterium CG1_02_49_16]
MTMETKKNIFREHLEAWLVASKKGRGEIIKNICAVAKVHPKSVPRSFRRVQTHDAGIPEKRGRKVVYGTDVTAALRDVFDAASSSCGENLHGQIAELVTILQRDGMWKHSAEATEKLLRMSVGLVKLRVRKFAHIRKMIRGRSTTKPGSIKSLIPIRSGPWDEAGTGTIQIDTVAHCNDSIAGDFVYTVNATDVATLWGVRRAQWNKGQEQTVRSMEAMNESIPFPVLEWHPDTGSEFVNWLCKGWADERKQRLTRSRPNRKNDNCFVEERNGHIVRKWVGYTRFDEPEVMGALNKLYDILTPYLNHFIASRRIIAKERIGARWKVVREKKSLTPYQRVMTRADVSLTVKTKLSVLHETLNPLVMKREVDRRLARVFDIHNRHRKPKL